MSRYPDTLPVIAGEFSLPAARELEGGCVCLPLGAALHVVPLYPPLVGPQHIRLQRTVAHCARVLKYILCSKIDSDMNKQQINIL